MKKEKNEKMEKPILYTVYHFYGPKRSQSYKQCITFMDRKETNPIYSVSILWSKKKPTWEDEISSCYTVGGNYHKYPQYGGGVLEP